MTDPTPNTEQPTQNPDFVLNLFGAFEARVDGQALPPLRSVKGKYLLALLALRAEQDVSRQWLAQTLWPDSETPSDSLRQSLSDLRQKLGTQAFRLDAPTKTTLRLNCENAKVDVIAFNKAVKQGDETGWRQAVELYRGDLLEGVGEVWVLAERESRLQAYLKALEILTARARVDGDTQAEIRYLRRLLASEPCHEAAARNLMTALDNKDEPQAALEVYHQLRQRLLDDGNAIPSAETRALFQRILKANSGSRQANRIGASSHVNVLSALVPEWSATSPLFATGGNVPHALTLLIGRESLLHDIKARILTHCLVTLVGTGGVGKTRLATQAARELMEMFEDGAWFVDLASVTSPTQVLQEIARVFGIRMETGNDAAQIVVGALRTRHLLLVLDNCETCLQTAANVAQELLRACPHLRLVATSRQKLGMSGEVVLSIPPLGLPDENSPLIAPNSWQNLAAVPAVCLFLVKAQSARNTFALTGENAPFVAEICERLDGLPLALELAAPLLEVLTPQQLAARLTERFVLLTDEGGMRPTRHQSLRAVIASSADLLPEAERILLRRLSVFVGGWTLEAADMLKEEANPHSSFLLPPSSFALLRGLVSKSLVVTEEWNGQMRYRMLESIREFAGEMLAEAGEMEPFRSRHLDWMLQTALQAEPELTGARQVAWLERLEVETSNLRAALDWAEQSEANRGRGLLLANALGRYWQIRGHFAEGRERLTRLLNVLEAQSLDSLRANALNWLALLSVFVGDLDGAEAACRAGLILWEQQEDGRGAAGARGILGIVAANRGDYSGAEKWYRQALEGARAAGDRHGEAGTLGYLGINAANQGYYEEAKRCYEASLQLRRDMNDAWGIAACLNNLGQLARKNGEASRARELLSESLILRRQLRDRRNVGITLNVLALLAWEQMDLREASACLREATDLFEQLGDRRSLAYALEAWARIAVGEHELEYALRWAEAARQLRQKIGSPLPSTEQQELHFCLHTAETDLGEVRAQMAREQGAKLPLPTALAETKIFGAATAAQKMLPR